METLTYYPQVFDVQTMDEAKAIILTPEVDATDERWIKETQYLADLIAERLQITSEDLLLDYGCGVGRLAKALIMLTGCRVIGVDISASMRTLSNIYVNDDRFVAVSPVTFSDMVARGLRVSESFSVWCLQHCLDVRKDVALINTALQEQGHLFVANDRNRIVPTVEQRWVNDGLNIKELLANEFAVMSVEDIVSDQVDQLVADCSFIGVYAK